MLQQISETTALVGDMEGLGTLEDEYAGDDIYCQKVQDLAGKYKSMRRTRPDGNCFYRAFGYAYLEQLLDNQEEYNRYLTIYWPLLDKQGNTVPLNVCHFYQKGKHCPTMGISIEQFSGHSRNMGFKRPFAVG